MLKNKYVVMILVTAFTLMTYIDVLPRGWTEQ
jgi:hypothetical protein